ncbi:hypothetical protein FQN49_007994 [Arthroderma sp. PD_2]|nr:hypothetical protein FQN49_007994 [Arthroderma sp. PD_2]
MASPLEKLPSLVDPSFVKIGPSVWLRDFPKPGDGTSSYNNSGITPVTSSSRLTIVILFWMDARLRYAVKYVSEYTKLAPNARIIFILTSSTDLFLNTSEARQIRRVQSAVDVLLSSATSTSSGLSPDDQLYLHLFSNGGSVTLRSIALAYRKATNKPLPLRSLIMDSCPGKSTLSGAHRAISYGLPKTFLLRLLAKILAWVGLLCGFAYCCLFRQEYPTELAWKASIDPKLIDNDVKRCYIYSELDDLISWKHVEEHSFEAASKNYQVTRERFKGSTHVGHMRLDPHRYWNIVTRYLKIAVE